MQGRDGDDYRWKGPNLLLPVRPETLLRIVNRHARLLTIVQTRRISILPDAFERPVPCPEIEHRGPVVGEILRVETGRAGGPLADVDGGVDGGVEGVAADDLVHVGRGGVAGLDDRVETLHGQGLASEAQRCEGRRGRGDLEGEEEFHLTDWLAG